MTSSTPLSSSGATLEFLKELVASSIESDDVGPLVKAVFEVAPPGEPLPLPLTRDSESGTTSQGEQLPQDSVLESVLELLQEVAEEKEAEIQQVCRSNASEIAGALHELGTMQRSTAALRQQLLANSATLQASGSSFAGRLEEVQQVESLQQQVAAARKAVSVALQVLQLCTQAAKYIEGRQLYKAFKTLEAVQHDHGAVLCGSQGGYLPLLPSVGAYASSRDGTPLKAAAGDGGGGTAVSDGGGGGDAELAEQLGPLAGFLRERVADLVALLEQRALSDFNNSWLANVRAQARTIGMRAIRWAAAERQQEEALTRQRKQLLQRLDEFQDVRQAGALVAQALHESEASQPPPATPLPLPTAADSAAAGTPGSPGAAAATGSPSHSPVPDSSSPKVASGSTSATAARVAIFRAARQAAGTSPTRSHRSTPASAAAAEVAVPAANPSPPGTAASASGRAATPAAASAAAAQTPPPQQRAGVQRPEAAAAATGNLLEGVDMTPLHRCVHIHTCLGRLPQFADYYATNRRQQLAADLSLHQGDFLNHYQTYLTQLAGFFLVEDAVQATAAGAAGEPLDIVAQVDAAWDAAVAALKAVLEPAFYGATAAAAMLTVKDFILLVCLALDHCGYQTVAVREVLMNSRARYHDLLAAATAASVQAAVAGDSLAGLAVSSQARADELLVTLALPSTFCFEDAANKRLPLKAPFSAMVPDLVRAIRTHITDSVAYLKGLLTAGEVVPAARQYRDRMLARVVVVALQRRVDAAAGDTRLPLGTGLQLVGNVAALRHVLPHLDEYLLAQARGESPATLAAAAAAAAAAASGGGGSPDRRGRSRSRSVSPSKLLAAGGTVVAGGAERGRGQQQQEGVEPEVGDGLVEDGQGSAPASAPAGGSRSVSPRPRSQSPGSSHGSAPSPEIAGGGAGPLPSQQLAAAAAVHQHHQQQQSGSQQAGHTLLSFAASSGAISSKPGEAAASSAATGSGAASLHAVLCSAEALVVQAAAAKAAGLLEAGEQLDWAPAEQQRSTAYSPYIDELIMHLKETASLLKCGAPSDCVERILRGLLRYVADAVMLQLMSDAVPAFNIFGLQRLFSDLGGVSRAAGSMGVPDLADELAEPLLFCELMVFGSLEDVLKPEQRAPGGRLAALDVRRMALVLEKYHELEKASAFASMHKSKQSERFISKKTVDRVLKELREHSRTASRASSVSGSAAGSFTAQGS